MIAPLLRPVLRAAAPLAPPHVVDGNRLDPELQVVLGAAKRLGIKSLEGMEVGAARAHSARMLRLFDAAPREMARVVECAAGEIPIHVYEPYDARDATIVFFHGGGGVIGSLATYDVVARLLADRTRCAVAMVEYRLAPEHPHPAAIDDAVAAWRWAAARFGGRLAVAGDSFGGFLSAWVERRARDEGLRRPDLMALIYPLLDLTLSSPSVEVFADGYLLTKALMLWFRGHYLADAARRPEASPLFLPSLAGAPPTLIVTAGFDPLRDEGRAYADRLSTAGSPVRYRCEGALVHGFLGMTGAFRAAEAAVARLCEDVVRELA